MSTIPKKFEGKIYFYWWTECGGSVTVSSHPPEVLGEIFIPLGETNDLTVDFCDPRAAIVESLEAQLVTERAGSQRRIATIQGRIQELLALEVKP